jgi:mannose/fructose/N-acetylgalactosamine-specific phosphotransferase system component IID
MTEAATNDNLPAQLAKLHDLARALRKLHKALLDAETRQFAAPVGSALEHLQLITTHPQFAWLLKLSGAMAELDERLDDKEAPLDSAGIQGLRTAIAGLVGPGEPIDPQFREQYTAMLHAAPEVVMAHSAVRLILENLKGTA